MRIFVCYWKYFLGLVLCNSYSKDNKMTTSDYIVWGKTVSINRNWKQLFFLMLLSLVSSQVHHSDVQNKTPNSYPKNRKYLKATPCLTHRHLPSFHRPKRIFTSSSWPRYHYQHVTRVIKAKSQRIAGKPDRMTVARGGHRQMTWN